VPAGLIEEPQTDAELMYNAIQVEFLLYDWQDYADALKEYIESIQGLLVDQ
jgi:hypothetical protein